MLIARHYVGGVHCSTSRQLARGWCGGPIDVEARQRVAEVHLAAVAHGNDLLQLQVLIGEQFVVGLSFLGCLFTAQPPPSSSPPPRLQDHTKPAYTIEFGIRDSLMSNTNTIGETRHPRLRRQQAQSTFSRARCMLSSMAAIFFSAAFSEISFSMLIWLTSASLRA